MCTVTWSCRADGYRLFFNRDERVTRGRALPPQPVAGTAGNAAYLAPADADAGGTWLAVDAAGLTVGLLNLYQAEQRAAAALAGKPRRSRGELVRSLAGLRRVEEVARALASAPLGELMPFTLFAIAAGEALRAWDWDGETLRERPEPAAPLVSSGVDVAGATRARTALWQELAGETPDAAGHLAFHVSHRPERGRLSPCMHRDDARTVSLTAVEVGAGEVWMAYADGSPCENALGEPLRLSREKLP